MVPIQRSAVAVGAMVLALSACGGGGSDAPHDASKADFCRAYEGDPSAYRGLDRSDDDKMADLLHEQAEDLGRIGTPKGISDDERRGFELEVAAEAKVSAADLKAHRGDDSSDAVLKQVLGLSGDDLKKVDAFDTYAVNLCE